MSMDGLLYFELDAKGSLVQPSSSLRPHHVVPMRAPPLASEPIPPPPTRSAEIHVQIEPDPKPIRSSVPDFAFDEDPFAFSWNFGEEPLSFGDDFLR
jgi:hypothetical protein